MTRFKEYYTVFVEYDQLGRFSGVEALVDPELTRADIIERLRSGEYASKTSRVVQIDHTADGVTYDVTYELIEAAEHAARALEVV